MTTLGDRIRNAGDQIASLGPSMIPGWLMTGGIVGWMIVGIGAALAIAAWVFGTSASISVPLLVAMVIGMIAYPLCERMVARGLSKAAAAGVVLILLAAIVISTAWIVSAGIVSQWPAIQAQMQEGLESLEQNLSDAGWDTGALVERLESDSGAPTTDDVSAASGMLSSALGVITAGIVNIVDLLFGLFIGTTLLYYVLRDWPTIASWMAAHMGSLPVHVGEGIVDDAVSAMRGYFKGTTITGVIVAATIGFAMIVMGIPLALPVALLTFLTCYIPYFGALISGAFAFIIALGTVGPTAAFALLAIVLIAQNVIQTVVSARVMGESLDLHPLVVLVVTMLGGIFAGLLGAALAAPLAALLINAGRRLQAAFAPEGVQTAEEPAPEPA